MDQLKRQADSIGNGPIKTQTGQEEDPTEARSRPSRPNTDSASGNITSDPSPEEPEIPSDLLKSLNSGPNTIVEALGLLQTRLFDLKSKGLRMIIEGSHDGKLFVVLDWQGHTLDEREGHILADGLPVLAERE